jgi:hypothetical protein
MHSQECQNSELSNKDCDSENPSQQNAQQERKGQPPYPTSVTVGKLVATNGALRTVLGYIHCA